MIVLTREAVGAVRSAMERAGKPGFGLRISAGSKCSGPQYALALESEPRGDDVVVEIRDVRVFIDPNSMTRLSGTTVDFSTSIEGSGFTFDNPNAEQKCGGPSAGSEHRCGCGK